MDPFIGEIRIFTGNFAPAGWFLCQGQLLPISNYQALFAIIGTNYGGNGTTNFQLPNLQGRFPIGVGNSPSGQIYDLGQAGGVEQIALTINNLPMHNHQATSPAHNHSVSVPAHTHPFNTPPHTHNVTVAYNVGGGANSGNIMELTGLDPSSTGSLPPFTSDNGTGAAGTTGQASGTTGVSGDTTVPVSIQVAGNSLPFSATPLYLGINYIIAYNGVFPSRG